MPKLLRVLIVAALPAAALAQTSPAGASLDRSTPLAAVSGFLDAAHKDDYGRAERYLAGFEGALSETQAAEGQRLARRLRFVLDRKLWLDFSKISSSPEGPQPPSPFEDLGSVAVPGGSRLVRLERVDFGGEKIWVFSRDTVQAIDPLFEAHGSALLERLPAVLFVRPFWVLELWQWLGLLLYAVMAFPVSRWLARLGLALAGRAVRLTRSGWDDVLIDSARPPARLSFLALLAAIAPRALDFPPPATAAFDVLARTLAIIALAWFLLRFVAAAAIRLELTVAQRQGADEGRSRAVRTQLVVLRRVLEIAIWVVAVSLTLLQFEGVRSVGVSLLASAGIAGLVIGLAAQKSIASLLAGIQLSITQPVRIGDTVIVEDEWGWIEEITLTYIVVKVWDLRRLVVPISAFLDKPFQNWSKVSPELLGTVELYADYRTDVAALRKELARILEHEAGDLWDGKEQGIQITGCSERTMTVRALVSAANSGKQWDLRCLVREKLIAYLQSLPVGLPVVRAETTCQPKP